MTEEFEVPDDASSLSETPKIINIGNVDPMTTAIYDQALGDCQAAAARLLYIQLLARATNPEDPDFERTLTVYGTESAEIAWGMDQRNAVLTINLLTSFLCNAFVEEMRANGSAPLTHDWMVSPEGREALAIVMNVDPDEFDAVVDRVRFQLTHQGGCDTGTPDHHDPS